MTEQQGGGGLQAAPSSFTDKVQFARADVIRVGLALVIIVGLALAVYGLSTTSGRGAPAATSLLVGVSLGVLFERGRFCFFCIFRDYIEFKNSGSLYSVLVALAVGSIGYVVVFSMIMPNSGTGRLPAGAHIGPVSWVLAVAGFVFGIGMALSGACISGHLYRLGQGYSRAPLALIGSLFGFGIGFATWNDLYLNSISKAPVAWLPASLGYGGALLLNLSLLGLIGLLLWRNIPALKPIQGGKLTARDIFRTLFKDRWNPLITGVFVGIVGMISYLRVEPLGVTSQLGSISRTVLNDTGYLPQRLVGLDTFAGCATAVIETITSNGLLISGLVFASFAVALIGGRFQLSKLTPINSITALLGGVLMGWGSMIALGCTVGVLLSGISAFAVSGWVFFGATFAGVFIGIKLRLHRWG
jgi:uncharacterized membrane protein YedE/YeeE